ncbi:dihydropteroate synthase [Haliangium sp.]|uniref:dihydropteroate synthase n=1 Tax=Haliangium sp. TaxID=2663208 RepID=UPI003D0E7484
MGLATIELRTRRFDWSRVYVMGVVNVTPDSFSDGGRWLDPAAAVAHGRALVAAGADLLDIGGESTRPGAEVVDAAIECARVVPVIEALAEAVSVPLSVDTCKAEVARAALAAGAEIVNDISGGRFDPEIVDCCAEVGAVFVCSHVRGRDLAEVHEAERDPPDFDEIAQTLAEQVAGLPAALRGRTIVDPGLGFGKRGGENLGLLARAGELGARLGCPVLVGPSRKRFIVDLVGGEMELRDRGTAGACLAAAGCGAQMVRVHDVAGLVPALRVYEAVIGAGPALGGGGRP